MAKGESGVQTANRYRDMLEEYIRDTPIEMIPLYSGKPSRMAISAALGFDRKRLDSPQCQKLILELERKVKEYLEQGPKPCCSGTAVGANTFEERWRSESAGEMRALERLVEKCRTEIRKLETKNNTLSQRVAVLTLELEQERRKNLGIVEHFKTSVRTLHVN